MELASRRAEWGREVSEQYDVDFNRIARKQLAALPKEERQRLFDRAQDLGRTPFPEDRVPVKGLRRNCEIWRIREGDYRIAYQVYQDDREVVIVGIATRGSIYEILKRQFG